MQLTKEEIKIGKQRVAELRKNPPKITEEGRRKADAMFSEHQEFERSKDRSIVNERQALAKDVAGFVHNHVNGVGAMFHGIGEGKARSIVCSFPGCGKHEGEMFNMKDGEWYCRGHKEFGNLDLSQKIKELYYA